MIISRNFICTRPVLSYCFIIMYAYKLARVSLARGDHAVRSGERRIGAQRMSRDCDERNNKDKVTFRKTPPGYGTTDPV